MAHPKSNSPADACQPCHVRAPARPPPPAPQVREAFLHLDHLPSEERLRQLLNRAAGRQATIRRKGAEAAARKRRVYLKQRANRFNKLHRSSLRAAKKLRFGMGWRATARQAAAAARGEDPQPEWWQRKLRPPGEMNRRF